jgi:hypothetical protein
VTAEQRQALARRIAAASRRLSASDSLVEAGANGRRRRWRSVLADGPAYRLERAAVAALDGDDLRRAWEAVERLERAAARAGRDARGGR